MKSNTAHFWVVAFLLIAGTFYFTKKYAVSAQPGMCLKDSTVVHYDTVLYYDTTAPVLIEEVARVIPAEIDSAKVVANYYTARSYSDSLQVNDVRIKVDYSIFENSLDSTRWQVQNLRPISENYYSARKYDNRLLVGLSVSQGIMAPSLTYQRNQWQFMAGYNISGEQPGKWLVGVHYQFYQW